MQGVLRMDCASRRRFTLANLGLDQPKFAELGGMWKAAQVKGLLYFFALKMTEEADQVEHGQLVALCTWALVRAINVFDGAAMLLSRADAEQARNFLYVHLQCWQRLAPCLEAHRIFLIRPKHHYLQHLADDVVRTRVNPRTFQCFDEESFLGRIKRMVSKCHASTVSSRCIQRYVLHLSKRWK